MGEKKKKASKQALELGKSHLITAGNFQAQVIITVGYRVFRK